MGRARPTRFIALAVGSVAALTVGAIPALAANQTFVVDLERKQLDLVAELEAVSDPSSPRFRRWMSPSQIGDAFGADAQVAEAVAAELASRGIETVNVDPAGGYLVARATTSRARAALGSAVRPGETWSVPAAKLPGRWPDGIRAVVGGRLADVSAPRRPLDAARRAGVGSGRPEGCRAGVRAGGSRAALTPNQVRTAFGFDGLHAAGVRGEGTKVALFETENAGFSLADVRAFAACFSIPEPDIRVVPTTRSGPIPPRLGGENTLESTLDIQAVMTAAPEAQIAVIQGTDDYPWAAVVAKALDEGQPGGLPDVLSISYGICERYLAAAVPGLTPAQRRAQRASADHKIVMDWSLASAGLAGVSVVSATGDNGSSDCASFAEPPTTVPGGALPFIERLSVDYPASSPMVTAVGGTHVRLNERNEIVAQLPWNSRRQGIPSLLRLRGDRPRDRALAGDLGITLGRSPDPVYTVLGSGGGGGVSRLHEQPSYQSAFPPGGRRVPDLSAVADSTPGLAIRCGVVGACRDSTRESPWHAVGGTSYATPLVAGAIALASQVSAAGGGARPGFVNPTLYAADSAIVFRDIVRGGNDVMGRGCCDANPGYDMASGWGSPKVPAFVAAIAAETGSRS